MVDSTSKNESKRKGPFDIGVSLDSGSKHDQTFYESVKQRYADERDIRLPYRQAGKALYTELADDVSDHGSELFNEEFVEREALDEDVEVLFIGGGFSALLASVRLHAKGVESLRIVEKGGDFGGAWYWNRYPGVACDVVSYDYLPLLDETGYVPSRHYTGGEEIFEYCKMIARKYDLYSRASFQTTVTSTVWNESEEQWHVTTDRGDRFRAQFVICANGTLAKPKLAAIDGMEDFSGRSFHTSRWDYGYTGSRLENLADKRVAVIGTGASAVQVVPELAKSAKHLYVFQRTPSAIFDRDDWETDREWADSLEPGWQAARRERAFLAMQRAQEQSASLASRSVDEKIRQQENANIDAMMEVHKHIEEVVQDKATAEALKPWYMLLCKRPCIHNDYLPSFNRDNVTLVDTKGRGVTRITPTGPEFDGDIYDVDLIVYATGFEVQQTGIYNQIVGKRSQSLDEKYADGIRTVLGIHSQGFPNLFVMGGLQAFFAFNLTDVLNCQGEHIAECIDYMRCNGLHSMDPTYECEEWWVQKVIENRGKTSRNKDCTPGYYNSEGADNRRQDGNYNGSMREYLDLMSKVRGTMQDNFEFSFSSEVGNASVSADGKRTRD